MQTNSSGPIEPALEVTLVAKLCSDANCPSVFRTNRGTLVVQGYRVSADEVGIDLPAGELLIEIPPELLSTAARTIG